MPDLRSRRGRIGHHTSARACHHCVYRRPASTRSSKSSRSILKTAGASWWRAGRPEDEATRLALAEFREGNLLARYMAPLRQAHVPIAITPGAPGRIRPPRCLARPALCDAHVEAATRLQPHGDPDARAGDRRDDGHVQRRQRSGHQATSISGIRKRRDRWRLGSVWNPAYERLPAGTPDVRVVRGEQPIVSGVRSVHCVRGDGDRVGESGTHEHVAGDERDPCGSSRATRAWQMVLARRPSARYPGHGDLELRLLAAPVWRRCGSHRARDDDRLQTARSDWRHARGLRHPGKSCGSDSSFALRSRARRFGPAARGLLLQGGCAAQPRSDTGSGQRQCRANGRSLEASRESSPIGRSPARSGRAPTQRRRGGR